MIHKGVRKDKYKSHLGGNIAGGDIMTFSPKLWDFIISEFNIESVLDVGCGEGHSTEFFSKRGIDSFGIDGLEENVVELRKKGIDGSVLDLTSGKYTHYKPVDLIWCCEFVEHLKEEYVDNIIGTFLNGNIVAMTHAVPGQRGHHHVNCKESSYWIELLDKAGLEYLPEITQEAREIESDKHFSRNGLIFKKH